MRRGSVHTWLAPRLQDSEPATQLSQNGASTFFKDPCRKSGRQSIAWQVLIPSGYLIPGIQLTLKERGVISFNSSTLFWKPRHHQDCKWSAFQRLKFSSHSIFFAFFAVETNLSSLKFESDLENSTPNVDLLGFWSLHSSTSFLWAAHWRSNHPKTQHGRNIQDYWWSNLAQKPPSNINVWTISPL